VIALNFENCIPALVCNLKAKVFTKQIQGAIMENQEIINRRVLASIEHIKYLDTLVSEMEMFTPPYSYLEDLIKDTRSKLALLRYNLDVANKITERIEV
jgi:hypothetical protein